MTALIQTVTQLVSAVFTTTTGEGAHTAWATSVVQAITSNPILLIGFILSIGGFAVGIVKRLTKLG